MIVDHQINGVVWLDIYVKAVQLVLDFNLEVSNDILKTLLLSNFKLF